MKRLIEKNDYHPIDSPIDSEDGSRLSFGRKLLLGLSPKEYLHQVLRNPLNWVLFMIFAVGLPVVVYRYVMGLGSVMHANYDYPWGLF